MELAPYGYNLKEGDIVNCSPLDNQARSSSKILIVIDYKNPQTRQDVVRPAREANLWNSRVPKGDDKKEGRKGFFKDAIPRRTNTNKREKKKTSLRCQAQGTAKAQAKTRVALAKQ